MDQTQRGITGWTVRKFADWTNVGKEELRKQRPDLSPEELEQLHTQMIPEVQRRMREAYAAAEAADPAWKPDASWVENLMSGRIASSFAGGMAGSINPLWLLNPGQGAASRVIAQGTIGAGEEFAGQSLDINDGVADNYDTGQIALNAAFAGGFQGLMEGAGKLYNATKGTNTSPDDPLRVVTHANLS